MSGEPVFVGLWLIAFILGVRGSIHLVGHYRNTAPFLPRSGRRLILALVLVAVIITVTAGILGFYSVRRLLGDDPGPSSAYIGALAATAILFIPFALDLVVERIAADTEGD